MSVHVERYEAARLKDALPVPARNADKYTRGKLTVVGGSEDYPGSVCLASKAGLYGGAGYVECACSPAAVPLVRAFAASVVARAWEGSSAEALGLSKADARHPKACLVGSGMFADDGFQDQLVEALIEGCAVALVLDGGAIRIVDARTLVDAVRKRAERGCVTVFTPHGGEAAALAQAARLEVPGRTASVEELAIYAHALARAYSAHILLKGPVSFIASPEDDGVYLMDQGTAALAKAGTGDVLAGLVGGFLAQAMDVRLSCVLGATVHAEAGRLAAKDHGIISTTAEEVLEALPRAIQSL